MLKLFKLISLSILILSCMPSNNLKTNQDNQTQNPAEAFDKIDNDNKIDELLQHDTLTFHSAYELQEFVKLFDIQKGSIKLLTLPAGSFDHLVLIESNSIKYPLKDIKAGKYMMDLRYNFQSKPYKRIYKIIRIERSIENKNPNKKQIKKI